MKASEMRKMWKEPSPTIVLLEILERLEEIQKTLEAKQTTPEKSQ